MASLIASFKLKQSILTQSKLFIVAARCEENIEIFDVYMRISS